DVSDSRETGAAERRDPQRRRAANVRHRPGTDGPPQAADARRALAGTLAQAGEAGVRRAPGDRRQGGHHSPGGAERPPRAGAGQPGLRPGDRAADAERTDPDAARRSAGEGEVSRRGGALGPSLSASPAQSWRPTRPVTRIAGTPAPQVHTPAGMRSGRSATRASVTRNTTQVKTMRNGCRVAHPSLPDPPRGMSGFPDASSD